jgi:hypothetical protein
MATSLRTTDPVMVLHHPMIHLQSPVSVCTRLGLGLDMFVPILIAAVPFVR